MSARTLRHVLDGSEGVLWNIDFGVEGTQQYWKTIFFNIETAQRLLRLEAKTPDDYATLWEESRLPVDREVVRERYLQSIRDRETTFSVQYRNRDKHGGIHWLRDHVRVQKTGERAWRFLIVTTDVTQERRASDVVSRTLRVLTHTLESSHLILWSADVALHPEPRWNLCLYNFAAAQKQIRFDVATPDAYVRAWQEALGEEQKTALEARWHEALANRETYYSRTVYLSDAKGVCWHLREDVRIEYHDDETAQVIIVSQPETTSETPVSDSNELNTVLARARCGIWYADLERGSKRLHGNVHLTEFGTGLLRGVSDTRSFAAIWQHAIPRRDRLSLYRAVNNALENEEEHITLELPLRLSTGGYRYLCADATLVPLGEERFSLVAIITDVTEHRRSLAELRAAQERYLSLVEHLSVGVYRVDAHGRFTMANAALLEMLGYSDLSELSTDLLWDKEARATFWTQLLADGMLLGHEGTWRMASGNPLLVRENAMAIRDEHTGELLGFEGTAENVTERQRAFEQLRRQAMLDPLTNLPNRSMALLELERLVSSASEHRSKIGVLYVDVDRFKEINEIHGHGTGDKVLVQLARRLQRATRPTDTIARTGGDEFLILTPDVLNIEETSRIATRVRRVVQEPTVIDGQSFQIDSSIGTVIYPQDGEDAETLLRHADIAMYQAKSNGGGVRSFTVSMHDEMRDRVTLETDLKRAVTENEFVLYYQPQLDVSTSKITGVEALVRWQHPERGLLPPSQFIPVAEESGLIVALGEWVLREACRQGAQWRRSGLNVRVAVNVSPRQFAQRDLPRVVARTLDEYGFPPERLDIELTESTLLEQERMVEISIAALRCLGVGLQIDDFGTGYSSLALLRRYRMEALKIDQGFIRGIRESPEDAAIVRSVIELAHTLGMVVIAEGVETDWHYACLRDIGCDFVQGYHFSPPVQADQIPLLVARYGVK